ncbi:hypothetical protein KAM355_39340 [Aeromonas caviae]|nr:hypothetical protein KAM355_39340 [Aeromonas caviae]
MVAGEFAVDHLHTADLDDAVPKIDRAARGVHAGGFILLQKRRTLHKAMAAQKAQLEETPATPKLDLNLPEQ